VALLACAGIVAACGTNVDLGGSGDAQAAVSDGGNGVDAAPQSDAAPPGGQCATCLVNADCASNLCVKFADYLFCSIACSNSAPCATGQTCSQLLSPAGATVNACLPSDTDCAPNNGPPGPDGAPLEHCGDLDAPGVSSTCKACGTDTDDCQPNGCYGGYWCDSDKSDCEMPPKTCP
jgi:hypothetical protein